MQTGPGAPLASLDTLLAQTVGLLLHRAAELRRQDAQDGPDTSRAAADAARLTAAVAQIVRAHHLHVGPAADAGAAAAVLAILTEADAELG